MIELGDKVKDKVSGFSGIAVGKTVYLAGCLRFLVRPDKTDKDGKFQEGIWFDEDELEVVKQKIVKGKKQITGGGANPPSRY